MAASFKAETPDAREIVRHSLEAEIKNAGAAKNYTFLQRSEERQLDDSGQVKSRQSKTYEVTMLEGSSYQRLI